MIVTVILVTLVILLVSYFRQKRLNAKIDDFVDSSAERIESLKQLSREFQINTKRIEAMLPYQGSQLPIVTADQAASHFFVSSICSKYSADSGPKILTQLGMNQLNIPFYPTRAADLAGYLHFHVGSFRRKTHVVPSAAIIDPSLLSNSFCDYNYPEARLSNDEYASARID